jgi:hypothetical protein
MKLPCCGRLFCDDCARPVLEETRVCPACNAIDVSPAELKPAVEERVAVRLARKNLLGVIADQQSMQLMAEGVRETGLPDDRVSCLYKRFG